MNSLSVRVGLAAAVLTGVTGIAATPSEIVLRASSASTRVGNWVIAKDSSSAGGTVMRNRDEGDSKITRALAKPANYFELTFQAEAGKAYRLWIRGRAEGDYWGNDSAFVQFSGSVTRNGSPIYRIGTTSAVEVNLEDCKGCRVRGWKWQDNGYGRGALGSAIYFARTGTQRLRVQTREDGLSIDQIVLSASKYLSSAPTSTVSSTPVTPPSRVPPAPAPEPEPDRTPEPDRSGPSGDGKLKVLHWNLHHGVGTDGACNLDRIASWIVKTGANVVSLNEVEKYSGWCGNIDMPARIESLVESKSGRRWNSKFAQRDGNRTGQGNMILTTFPIESSGDYELSYSRSVARVEVVVGSRRVNIFSTHLDADSGSRRATQMRELTRWASTYPEQRILAGDYNAWPGGWELSNMKSGHYDAWAESKSDGTAVAYSGNEAGNTRRSRIDFIFFSKGARGLELKQARVFDVRDSRGVMPSDHRPLMATYEVD